MTKPKPNLSRWAMILAMASVGTGSLLAQITIPATHRLPSSAADLTKPGFIFNVSEVALSEPNDLAWAEDQIAGLKGANLADPNAQGIADGIALPPNPTTAPISFTISSWINLSKDTNGDKGDFIPDDQMPGLPGTGPNGSDNAAAEMLTYLDLPAGSLTMGVNSDDGFRVTIAGANPIDKFGVNVGQFNGGRGANDTFFTFNVPQAGLYAARLLWENGGGDANVEWFTVTNGTTLVLIGDVANGGIAAYRAVTAPAAAYAKSVDPAPVAIDVSPTEGVHVVLVDGATPVATSSISLEVDGVPVVPTITKPANIANVDYNVTSPWPSRSTHTASFAYTDGAIRATNTWSWTVQNYVTLSASWVASSVDTSKPGFNWNIYANSDSANTDNSIERGERDLSLQAMDASGNSLPNNADPNAVGAAVGAGTQLSPVNGPIHFEIATTINLDTAAASMPGAPSVDATTDGQAAEILTYLNLPAGVLTMQVDAVQGWRLYAGGQPADVFGRAVMGEFNGRSGVTRFGFNVPQAGIYPFRLVWENQSGASHIIWSTVDNAGNTHLVNDLANGGIPAYRALLTGTIVTPIVTGVSPLAALHQQELANTNVFLVIADGTHPVDDTSVTLTIDGKSVTPIKARQVNLLTVSDGGAGFPGLQLAGDVHTGILTYKDSTGTYSRTQQWNFNNIQVLTNIPSTKVAGENFDAFPEATSPANTVPPGWHAWNFTLENTPGWDLADKSSDAYKDWVIISDATVVSIEGSSLNNDPNQTYNGQPVDAATFSTGNILWATSDGRSGPQVQFCTSPPFNLSSVTNPVMIYSSLMRMSAEANVQADGIEYSVDGGNTWNAGIIYVTIAHSRKDYQKLSPDGSLDPDLTLHDHYVGAAFGFWTDIQTGLPRGGDFASGLAEPVTPAMAPIMAIRSDNTSTSTKIDGFRLPLASKQSDVRLRFYQCGNCSWWWGVDNLAFYDIAPPVQPVQSAPHIDSTTISAGQITIKWSNGGTLETSPTVVNPVWTTTGNSSGTFTGPVGSGNLFYHVKR